MPTCVAIAVALPERLPDAQTNTTGLAFFLRESRCRGSWSSGIFREPADVPCSKLTGCANIYQQRTLGQKLLRLVG